MLFCTGTKSETAHTTSVSVGRPTDSSFFPDQEHNAASRRSTSNAVDMFIANPPHF